MAGGGARDVSHSIFDMLMNKGVFLNVKRECVPWLCVCVFLQGMG